MITSLLFTATLFLGQTSPTVMELQKILNRDPQTIVAVAGPGSPGNETNYFGPATRNAVIRFQEAHASQILIPNGLTRGTGVVGPATRALLNSLVTISDATLSAAPATTPTPPVSSADQNTANSFGQLFAGAQAGATDTLMLAYPSSYSGRAGDTLTLYGSGFTSHTNTIHIGTYEIKNISSNNSSLLSFALPANISPGRYDISVSNEKGTTPEKTFFVVTASGAAAPVIERVEPASGGLQTPIKIIGKNFSPTENEVRTNFGILQHIPSADGTTLTITLSPENLADLQESFAKSPNVNWPVYMYVVSAGGVSAKDAPGVYTIKK